MNRLAMVLALASVWFADVGCNSGPTAGPVSSARVSAVSEVAEGNWKVDLDTNPVTGETTKTAYLQFEGKQNIYIRQTGRKLDCYITTDEFLETIENLHTRNSLVQYKFDSGKIIRQNWKVSDSNNALFYPGDPKPFLAQLRHAKSFAIEYRPVDRLPATITFDVAGFLTSLASDRMSPCSHKRASA